MRFVTFGWRDRLYAGVEHAGGVVSLSDLGFSAELQFFVADGVHKLARLRDVLASITKPTHVFSKVSLWPPLRHVHVVACTGLNYRKHAEESGAKLPRVPVWFNKLPSAITGPERPIILPRGSTKVDFEAELVLIIGKAGQDIPEDQAGEYIFGCTCGHDVSARDWQLERDGGQWWIGKTSPTFAPIGPAIVTLDELGDIHTLPITFRLNGTVMQESNTADMVFSPERLISHLSQHIPLNAGDLIFTGTPGGIGHARKPPIYLKAGDICEVEIGGIGVLRNPVTAAP